MVCRPIDLGDTCIELDLMAGSAFCSRFFTLAHEIAHNLVLPHNSEHEFYFSATCEEHMIPFGKLLAEESS
jgi:hypothetical protein